jgi:hypothetical protein
MRDIPVEEISRTRSARRSTSCSSSACSTTPRTQWVTCGGCARLQPAWPSWRPRWICSRYRSPRCLLRRRLAERRCQQPLRAQPAGRGGDAARCRILSNHRVPAVDRQQGVGHPEQRRTRFIAAASDTAAASPSAAAGWSFMPTLSSLTYRC